MKYIGYLCIILVLKCWHAYLLPCILFPFPTHPSADLSTCQTNTGPQFIYGAFLRPHSAYALACQIGDLPTYSPAYFPHIHPSAELMNLPDEYRSPSSFTEHFCIPIAPKCRPANMPTCTYSPVYFPHFLLTKVLTCWAARHIQVPINLLYGSVSSKCRPAYYFYLCYQQVQG